MFNDRSDAAQKLAIALEKYKGKNAIVLGIPRGGAVTAYYVAKHLDATFSLLIARKLGHPANPEYAIGAIAEDGSIYLNPAARYEVTETQIETAVSTQKQEIERRIRLLRHGEPLPVLKDRIVILVDDGIATGATLMAAIGMCKKQSPSTIVVGAPVSDRRMVKQLKHLVDDVVVLETPDFYHAVSQVYLSFEQVTDAEASALLEAWKKEKQAASHLPSTK